MKGRSGERKRLQFQALAAPGLGRDRRASSSPARYLLNAPRIKRNDAYIILLFIKQLPLRAMDLHPRGRKQSYKLLKVLQASPKFLELCA